MLLTEKGCATGHLFEWGTSTVDRQVIFPGWVDKKNQKLGRLTIALPSAGGCNIILEALGFDLPCFGSRIPGIRDILLHEELLFDPKDEKALAANIDRYFSDDQHSHYLMELCRERKEKFTFDWKERVFQTVTENVGV
jgi:glycosyltransferase involved in cell wall biosynthesis